MPESMLTPQSSNYTHTECAPAKSPGKGAAFWLALGAMLVALFLHALDMCAIPTALPTIIDDLHGGDKFIWVGSAYGLASTAILFPCSRFADVFGRKVVLLTSITSFAVGSALAGASQNMDMLIAARSTCIYSGISSWGVLSGCRSSAGSRGRCHILHVQYHHVRPRVAGGTGHLPRLSCFDVLPRVRCWARSGESVDEVSYEWNTDRQHPRVEVCPLARPGAGYSVSTVSPTHIRMLDTDILDFIMKT